MPAQQQQQQQQNQPVPRINILSSLDRRTHELYIRSRALHHLQRSYRTLSSTQPEEIESMRARAEQDKIGGVSTSVLTKRKQVQALQAAREQSQSQSQSEGTGVPVLDEGTNDGRPAKKLRKGGSSSTTGQAGGDNGEEQEETHADTTQGGRSRQGSGYHDPEGSQHTNVNAPTVILPHIDSTYLLELTPAKPEAATVVIGEPPRDVYISSRPRRADERAIVQLLTDSHAPGSAEQAHLFYDLEGLTFEQVKGLACTEWSRELSPSEAEAEPQSTPATVTGSAAGKTTAAAGNGTGKMTAAAKRQLQQQQQQQQQDLLRGEQQEQQDLEAEIAAIRRAFCDRARAQALAQRAAGGW